MSGTHDDHQIDEVTEARQVGEVLSELLAADGALDEFEKAMAAGDADELRRLVARYKIGDRWEPFCRWLCSWHVQRICFWLCRDIPLVEYTVADVREATLRLAELAAQRDELAQVVEAVTTTDEKAFHELLERHGLLRWCRLVCVVILTIRCEFVCDRLHADIAEEQPDLLDTIRQVAFASASLVREEPDLEAALKYFPGDPDSLRGLVGKLGLIDRCHFLCLWFCVIVPFLRCLRICLQLPGLPVAGPVPQPPDPGPIRDWAKVTVSVIRDEQRLHALLEPIVNGDDRAFLEAVRRFDVVRWCPFLCFWLYRIVCHRICIRLCPPPTPLPLFRRIGVIPYATQVDSGPTGTGLTTVDSRAFFGVLRLNGVLHQQLSGQPAQYRFEIKELPSGPWEPVLPPQIAKTTVGTWTRFTGDPMNPTEAKDYTVNGTNGPEEITITPAADGWIPVPQESNYWAASGLFTSNGDMVMLDTSTVVGWPDLAVSGVDAGESVGAAGPGEDRYFGIRLRVRQGTDSSTQITAGTAQRLAVFNGRYDQVAKGGSWSPSRVDDQLAVASLNIDEIAGGCSDVVDQLHVRYTAAHPNLGDVSISVTGPGGHSVSMSDDAAASSVDRFGVAEPPSADPVGDWAPCSYIVTLSATVLLTTGDATPDPVQDQLAFHKM